MSTLFLTYFFPPGNTPAARRINHLCRRIAASEPVYVITATPTPTNFAHVAQTIEVASPDLRSVLHAAQPSTVRAEDKVVGSATKSRAWVKSLLPLRQAFPFLYLTDDGGPVYRRRAYQKACELIEKHGITTVFSSFRPWSDHLVARRLNRKYPALRWVADFRDLPVDPVRKDVWWPALQTWWGRRTVRLADEVWVVSEGQREQLLAWHPNIKVCYNPLLALPPERTAPQTERFTLVYTGSLYPGLQSLAPVVLALQNLLSEGKISSGNLCLVYRGKDHEVFRQWTKRLPVECLDIQPSIAPAAAQKMQQKAQLLLLLNWSAPGYYGVLTAKLWDYLAAGRPMVALVNGPGDQELEAIVAGANAGAVFADGEQGALATYLLKQYGTWLNGRTLPHLPNLPELKKYLYAE